MKNSSLDYNISVTHTWLSKPIRYLAGSEEGHERVSLTLEDIVDALASKKEAAVSDAIQMFRGKVIPALGGDLRLQRRIFEGLKSLRA